MELEGKITVAMHAQSGVSQSTGNQWMSQEYVMAYYWFPNQTQPSYIVMRVFGEDRIKQFNLQPNDEVRVRFHVEAHEYNGRWFNEIRIDAVTFIGASAYKNPQVLHIRKANSKPHYRQRWIQTVIQSIRKEGRKMTCHSNSKNK